MTELVTRALPVFSSVVAKVKDDSCELKTRAGHAQYMRTTFKILNKRHVGGV